VNFHDTGHGRIVAAACPRWVGFGMSGVWAIIRSPRQRLLQDNNAITG
jgi:hypothetical protein